VATTSGYAGSATTAAYGSASWADEAETVGVGDSTTASVTVTSTTGAPTSASSNYIINGTFGLAAAAASAAVSVTVTIKARSTGSIWTPQLFVALYLPDGTVSSFVGVAITPLGGALANYVFGGDLWGLSQSQLQTAVLNSATFRVKYYAYNPGAVPVSASAVNVDSVFVLVDYIVSVPEILTNSPVDFVRPAPKKKFVYV